MVKISSQRGNAFLYVLIAIALFAALSLVLGRQTSDTSEAEGVAGERTNMYATQILAHAASVKSIVDQMMATGTLPDNLSFVKPADAGYAAAPHIAKVYHPEGGGLTDKPLAAAIAGTVTSDPPAGWYLGRFNTVEWSPSAAPDVILTAFQISKAVCAQINEQVTGSTAIPVLGASARDLLVDAAAHGGANADFTVAACAACEGMTSLCVKDNAQEIYAYYSLIVDR